MKRIFSILIATLLGVSSVYAQCSSEKNNFEMRLIQTGDHQLSVQMRYSDGAVNGATSVLPNQQFLMDGLIFAITWPTSSTDIAITKCQSSFAPLDIIMANDVPTVQNKTSVDNVQTFLHNNIDNPTAVAFSNAWENNKWVEIAAIQFSGTLASGDYFSFLNCDYGLAHPNSYYGNSTTDPWFAMFDAKGEYVQYSPKMITELPNLVSNSIKIYPVPTTGELTIEVECASTTNAVVKVIDMNGRLVKTILFDLEKGSNKNQINIGELPQGDYMIQLTDGKAINFSKQVSKI